MKEIKFEFDIDLRVVTEFHQPGIIVALFFDESGRQYLVRTKEGDVWHKEKDLRVNADRYSTRGNLKTFSEDQVSDQKKV